MHTYAKTLHLVDDAVRALPNLFQLLVPLHGVLVLPSPPSARTHFPLHKATHKALLKRFRCLHLSEIFRLLLLWGDERSKGWMRIKTGLLSGIKKNKTKRKSRERVSSLLFRLSLSLSAKSTKPRLRRQIDSGWVVPQVAVCGREGLGFLAIQTSSRFKSEQLV